MPVGAIYVDDSGNPGADSGSEFLPSERKSWTAVVVPSSVADHVQIGMDIFLGGVRSEFGAEELHFTEIYSGKGPWKAVRVDKRAEMISLMAGMMSSFSLPIIHQSISDWSIRDRPSLLELSKVPRSDGWNLKDISHFGFLMLCSQTSKHVRWLKNDFPNDLELPLPLFVDEGLMQAGRDRRLPNWGDVISGPKAQFRKSIDVPGIQLADFAAFVISRSQWAIVNKEDGTPLKEADELILRAAGGLNILNLPARRISPEELGRRSYEEWLAADRVAKSLPPFPTNGIDPDE